jgi:hypothetical protein
METLEEAEKHAGTQKELVWGVTGKINKFSSPRSQKSREIVTRLYRHISFDWNKSLFLTMKCRKLCNY